MLFFVAADLVNLFLPLFESSISSLQWNSFGFLIVKFCRYLKNKLVRIFGLTPSQRFFCRYLKVPLFEREHCTRLTVLPKCLGRKRCCDATPDRCLGGVSSHYLRIVNKCVVFFQKSRVLVGSQGLKRTKWKNEYAQRRRLRREMNSTSKSEVFPTWAPLPNPKENES